MARVPGASGVVAIAPILLLAGVQFRAVAIVSLVMFVTASALRASPRLAPVSAEDENIAFAIVVTLIGLLNALGQELLSLLVMFLVLVFAIFSASLVALRNKTHGNRQILQTVRANVRTDYAVGLAMGLFLLGWQSIGYYAVAIAIASMAHRRLRSRISAVLGGLVVLAGTGLSFRASQDSLGQYWLSADQLFRSTIAAGLSRWGYTDFSGAVGSTIKYQWLGEATAGVVARYSLSSAADGVSKVLPALGLLVSLSAFRKIGAQLAFDQRITALSGLLTIVVCKEFELYSVGSLWGFSLFLIGLSVIGRQVASQNRSGWGTSLTLVLVTPLITLSQSTLGLHFVVLTMISASIELTRRRQHLFNSLLVVSLQVLSIVLLRATLLENSDSAVYDPRVSIRNVLQFRGLNIYLGENPYFIAGVSILFLLLLSQSGAGLVLLRNRRLSRQVLWSMLAAPTVSSLVLSNTFSIGGVESQQSRFLSPLVVVVTFVSALLIFEQLFKVISREQLSPVARVMVCLVLSVTAIALVVNYKVFNAAWSWDRTAAVALLVLMGQGVLVVIVALERRRTKGFTDSLLLALSLLGVLLVSHGRDVASLVEVQQTAGAAERTFEFVGTVGTRDCLAEVRKISDRDAVIASNWFRNPPPASSPKYFLVSAWTERRLYIDGPMYVSNTTGGLTHSPEEDSDWIEFRAEISDEFAEQGTKESHDALVSSGVKYFVVNAQRPTASTWIPFADVVLERDTCKVLKLRA